MWAKLDNKDLNITDPWLALKNVENSPGTVLEGFGIHVCKEPQNHVLTWWSDSPLGIRWVQPGHVASTAEIKTIT